MLLKGFLLVTTILVTNCHLFLDTYQNCERVTGRKARGLQMEEIACKCQTFLSLLSGRRKQTNNIFFLLYTNLEEQGSGSRDGQTWGFPGPHGREVDGRHSQSDYCRDGETECYTTPIVLPRGPR